MKKLQLLALALIIMVPALESCKKLVTAKKLDGTWKVTSGTMKQTYKHTYKDGEWYEAITDLTFDGTKFTGTENYKNSDGDTDKNNVTYNQTIEYTFSKDNGTYKSTEVGDRVDTTHGIEVFKDSSGIWVPKGYVDRVEKTTETVTTDGTFQITGGTGETDKNSQFVLQPTDISTKEDVAYSYVEAGKTTAFATSGFHYWNWNTGDYETFETSDTHTVTETGMTSEAEVLVVTENKKGVMTISMTEMWKTTEDGDIEDYSSEAEFEFTEQ
jgi:hypothetical protein